VPPRVPLPLAVCLQPFHFCRTF